MKLREEDETLVATARSAQDLRELGLHIWFRYEKSREEFYTRT